MSDMDRHMEATDIEEARHMAAGESEMALHRDATPLPTEAESHASTEASHAHVEVLDASITLAQAKAKRAIAIAVAVGGVVLLAILAALVLTIRGGNSDSQIANRKIDELSQQLTEAQHALTAAQATNSDKTLCADRFTNAQRAANLDAFAAQNEIVNALIPTVPPMPQDERQKLLDDLRDQGDKAIRLYRDLVAKNTAWGEAGRPLPCPLAA